MSNLAILFWGELERMKKYHILTASIVAALILFGVLYLINMDDVSSLFPLLLFIDATSMSILLIGATVFFEKQEGVLKSFLVSPVKKSEYILAKTLANVAINLISLILLYLLTQLVKEVRINLLGLLGGIFIVSTFHSLVGFYLTYKAKSFTDLLVEMFKYFLVLLIPVLFDSFGLVKSQLLSNLLYILPTKASLTIMNSAAGVASSQSGYLSAFYLLLLAILLYIWVENNFREFAIKEGGA